VTDNTRRMVPLDSLLTEFGREELRLKQAGDFQHAGWVRNAIVRILRLADGQEPSLDPSSDPT
jgi:hypothetical protein